MNSNKHSKMTALALALTIIISLFNNFTVFAENGLNDETVTENPVIEDKVEETEPNEGVEEVGEPSNETKSSEEVEGDKQKEGEVPVIKIEEQKKLFSGDRSPENYSIKYRYDWPNFWMHNNIVPRARFKDGYTTIIKAEKKNSSNDNIVIYSDITTFEGIEVDGNQIYVKSANIPLMNDSNEVEIFARKTKTNSWENISSKLSGTNISLTKEDGYGALKIVYKNVNAVGEVEIKINYAPTEDLVSEVMQRPMNAKPADITSYIGLTVQDANTDNWSWEYNGGDYLIKYYPEKKKADRIGDSNSSYQGIKTENYRTVEESGKEVEVLRGEGYQDDWTQNNSSNLRILDWLSISNEPTNGITWDASEEKYLIKHTGPNFMPGGMQNLPVSDATYVLFLPKNILLDESFTAGSYVMWAERIGDLKAKEVKTELVTINGEERQKVTITIDFDGKEWLSPNAGWKDIPLYTTDFDTYKCGSDITYPTRLVINGIYNVNGDDLNYHELDREHINTIGWYKDSLGAANTPDKSKLVDNDVNDWVFPANVPGKIPCITIKYDPNPPTNNSVDPPKLETVTGATPVDDEKYSYALKDSNGNIIRDKAIALDKGEMVCSGGYQFDSWNTEPDGSGAKYLPGEEVPVTEGTVLYAIWVNTVDIEVNKIWNDFDDRDGKRATSVTIQLYVDGTPYRDATGKEAKATLNSGNNWKYIWENLLKYDDQGREYKYTITEDKVLDYTNEIVYTTQTVDAKTKIFAKVTNTYEPPKKFDDFILWDWGHTSPTIDGTKLHRAYINGYPDGSVKPQGEITRGEVAAIISRLHADVEDIEYATETKYSDVKATDWYAKHIAYVSDKGLMEGYEDGSFKPEEKITRAEYATVVARFKNLERIATTFEDSSDHWASEYIGAVANKKWITGYPDGSFKPTNNISREEVATMTNKMLDRNVDEQGVNNLNIKKFTDLEYGTWSYYELVEASNTHEYLRRGTDSIVEDWKSIID